ncbi:MAG TPA: virulence factor SrfC family protein [Candidatus Competibacteraceae bacterium]|nr:virulence factor SrfC family protein [Candidatus Competibacteraceae bacterium]HSA44909.1 virulence factor SrfC family protein [Candidatus Competibacteraceae bacterium]
MLLEDEQLAARCQTVGQALQTALTWVDDQRDRIGQASAGLHRDLRKNLLLARSLETAARRKMGVSVFGPSQAGKSYLVSALARPGIKPLIANFAGQSVDFIREINPEGGRESTGLVTRFTLDRSTEATPDYPVELRLLTQSDLVKIIGNTYYADCRHDDWPDPEPEAIIQRLAELAHHAQPTAVDPWCDDDLYDLEDYFWRSFRGAGRIKVLKNTPFWNQAADLAPRLPPTDRARLLALLWGDVEAFTQLYLRLYHTLKSLDFAPVARCPLTALTPRELSIIDVQMLRGLGTDGGDRVTVLARTRTVELPRAEVAALTAELQIVLEHPPAGLDGAAYDFFAHTDLLDFPGARSREQIKDLPEYLNRPEALSGFFLRGKVAYLFERYCAEQELTAMLLCIGPGNQEVRGLPDLVNDWIAATHGATADARADHPTSLFLVLTKFDMEFEQKAGASDDPAQRWSIRLYSSLLDFFGKQHDWPRHWDPQGGFRHAFWLRNPNFKQKAIFDYDGDRERQVRDAEQAYIASLRAGFLNNPDVRRHFADPARAWDAAMRLNDGGVGYLVEQLDPMCQPELKRRQVARRLDELARVAAGRLRSYYVSDDVDAERARKRQLGKTLARKLVNCAASQRFGEFLWNLYVSDESLYDVYFQIERQPDEPQAESAHSEPELMGAPVDTADLLGLFGDDEPDEPTPASEPSRPPTRLMLDAADRYASEVIAHWLDQLRELSGENAAQSYFGLAAEEFSALVHELATGAERLELCRRIAAGVRDASHFHNIHREKLAWKQAALAAALLNAYVSSLGFDPQSDSTRRPVITVAGRQRPLFAPRPPFTGYPPLGPKPLPYDQDFYADWLYALTLLIEGNVAGAVATAAGLEKNRRLDQALAALDNRSQVER